LENSARGKPDELAPITQARAVSCLNRRNRCPKSDCSESVCAHFAGHALGSRTRTRKKLRQPEQKPAHLGGAELPPIGRIRSSFPAKGISEHDFRQSGQKLEDAQKLAL